MRVKTAKGFHSFRRTAHTLRYSPGRQNSRFALDTGLPLKIEAGRASFSLLAPGAGSVQVELLIPGDHTVANLNSGLITGRKSENGHTAIEATLVPGQPATFWWATREAVTPVVHRDVRFLADAKTLVSVSDAEMRLAILADITVIQGEPSQFQVELPSGYELTGVTGATLDRVGDASRSPDPQGERSQPTHTSVPDFDGTLTYRCEGGRTLPRVSKERSERPEKCWSKALGRWKFPPRKVAR